MAEKTAKWKELAVNSAKTYLATLDPEEIEDMLKYFLDDLKSDYLFSDYCNLKGVTNKYSVELPLRILHGYQFWVDALKRKAFALAKVLMYIYAFPRHRGSNKIWEEGELWDEIFKSDFSIDKIINGEIGFYDVKWKDNEIEIKNLLSRSSVYICSEFSDSSNHKYVKIESGVEGPAKSQKIR